MSFILEECIAAVATPIAPAGICVIRLSGENAIEIASKVFVPVKNQSLLELDGYRAAYGHIVDGDEPIDDAVALVFRAPNSYTGEDVVEVSCHGGMAIIDRALELFYNSGARPAQSGEFTKRAFLNDKMTLTQAEAVMDVINAQSVSSLKAANSAKKGVLYRKIHQICDDITKIDGHIQAWLDYPDEDLDLVDSDDVKKNLYRVKDDLENLLNSYKLGNLIKNGVKTVIVGRPNVGKSTIMNFLSGEEKSIVTNISGTTRDIVENVVQIDGLMFVLFDTAGIRLSDDVVEKIGVERAKAKIKEADLVLFVVDGSEKIEQNELEVLEYCENIPKICILNKMDLGFVENSIDFEKFDCVIETSSKDPQTMEKLKHKMISLTQVKSLDCEAPLLFNERQKLAVKKALDELKNALGALESGFTWDAVVISIDAAIDNLLELTGENLSEHIVNEVFSKFCVGK